MNNHTESREASALHDMNGDGLPDLVTGQEADTFPPQPLVVYYNTGNGFESVPTQLDVVGASASSLVSTTSRTVTVPFRTNVNTGDVVDGYTVATRRMYDLDGDGLPDVGALPAPEKNQYQPNTNSDSSVTFLRQPGGQARPRGGPGGDGGVLARLAPQRRRLRGDRGVGRGDRRARPGRRRPS